MLVWLIFIKFSTYFWGYHFSLSSITVSLDDFFNFYPKHRPIFHTLSTKVVKLKAFKNSWAFKKIFSWLTSHLNRHSQWRFTKSWIGVNWAWINRFQMLMLTQWAVNWNMLTWTFSSIVLEQRVDRHGKVEFDEEENDADFSNLESEENSDESKWQCKC